MCSRSRPMSVRFTTNNPSRTCSPVCPPDTVLSASRARWPHTADWRTEKTMVHSFSYRGCRDCRSCRDCRDCRGWWLGRRRAFTRLEAGGRLPSPTWKHSTLSRPYSHTPHSRPHVLTSSRPHALRTLYSVLRTSYSRTLHSVLPHPLHFTVQREDSSTSQIERAHACRLAVRPTRSRATSTTSECGRRTPSPDARPPRSCLHPPRVSPSGT